MAEDKAKDQEKKPRPFTVSDYQVREKEREEQIERVRKAREGKPW